ncbi:MAG: carbohydrate-binding domain-containing protein [Treponemataceae bacterium]|nr:carbohydrate-binding domain-containing protein [Treponemataceae bacterium]
MKKTCRNYFIAFFLISLLVLTSCQKEDPERAKYGNEISISPMDSSVKVSKTLITIFPEDSGIVYTISGYFKGQIVVATKNTILKLDNAYIENPFGKPAINCKAKTEISTVKGSNNYLISYGRSYGDSGAIYSKKTLVLGGSGSLYVKGKVCHAVEGADLKIKGSGLFDFEASKRGSAICCQNLTVENDKTFDCYLKNSKNGIKADGTIEISSGNFFISGNDTALKTDTAKEKPKMPHYIKLNGGNFEFKDNGRLYVTDKDAFYYYKDEGE